MPRRYERKSLRASAYTREELNSAIKRIRSKELSHYAASKMYGIPVSTLNDHVTGKYGLKSQTLGRPPAIPIEMENKLTHCLKILEKWGWGLSRTEIMDLICEFIKANKIKTPFKDDRPGADWFISFKKRHHLSIKKPQSVEYLRKRMTDPFVIHEYFTLLEETLFELGINQAEMIWNLDETSVCLDPSKTKVVGGIGKPCTRTTTGTGKENITVLTTVNAAGVKLSPLIIFKGKKMYEEWMATSKNYDFEVSYAASKRGWMETDIFFNYMEKIVLPALGNSRPVLMIYDGHSIHVDLRVVMLAVENNVTILKLPAHTSHLLQPLDLAVFKSFKNSWDKKLVEWQRQNVGVKIRKQVFADLFAETWQQVSPEVIRSGFRKGGIYPFNANVIPEEKYDPVALRRWKQMRKKPKTLQSICLEIINKELLGITDKKVTSGSANNTSSYPDGNVSFEELLLQKVTKQPQNTTNKKLTKLTRIAKGSEVITRSLLEKMKEAEKDTSRANPQPTDNGNPGPSNMKKKTKDIVTTKEKESETKIILSKKGKGVGKKSRTGNQSLIVKNNVGDGTSKNQKNTYKIQQKLKTKKILKKSAKILKRSLSVTTTESGEMSTHSDSDILDALSDSSVLEPLASNMLKNNQMDLDPTDEIYENSQEHGMCKDLGKYKSVEEGPIGKKVKECPVQEKFEEQIKVKKLKKQKEFNEDKLQRYDKVEESKENKDQKYLSKSINPEHHVTKEKVTILSSVRYKPENFAFIGNCEPLQLKIIDKNFDISQHNKLEQPQRAFDDKGKPSKTPEHNVDWTKKKKNNNEDAGEKTDGKNKTQGKPESNKEENEGGEMHRQEALAKIKMEIIYKKAKENKYESRVFSIGDTVLTRYYTKCWKYYVGVIEQIIEQGICQVSYYKSIGKKKDNLKFGIPKRKDQDQVPEGSIVKQIELLQIKESQVEFVLMNDEDFVYF